MKILTQKQELNKPDKVFQGIPNDLQLAYKTTASHFDFTNYGCIYEKKKILETKLNMIQKRLEKEQIQN